MIYQSSLGERFIPDHIRLTRPHGERFPNNRAEFYGELQEISALEEAGEIYVPDKFERIHEKVWDKGE